MSDGYLKIADGVYLADVSSQYAKAVFNYLCEYSRKKHKLKKIPEFHYEFCVKESKGSLYLHEQNRLEIYLNFQDFDGKHWRYVEYATVYQDPEIGSFRCADWRPYLDNLIAHEMAHMICHVVHKEKKGKPSALDDGYHGDRWKKIYKDLVRQSFCAPKAKKLKCDQFVNFDA